MICIKNATIHDGLKNVFQGDILIDDGQIKEIKDNIDCDCEVIDASGKHVFPGFIDPMSNWGILGPGREIRGNAEDNDEHTNVLTPEMNIIYAFNGRGITRQQLGAFGITSVGTAPSNNNLFGGMMAAFDVDGLNPFKMCIKEKLGLKACVTDSVKKFWGAKNIMPSTHMGIFAMMEEQFRLASEYDPSKGRDPKKEAIKEVLDKKMPLFVVAENPMEIHSLFHVTEKYDIDLVLCSGYGLKGAKEEILERKPGIIVNNVTSGFDPNIDEYDAQTVVDLYNEGLCVALASNVNGTMCSREEILWNGIDMYKVCHDEEAVLQMMTYNTAKVLGIDDVTGSIEVGKRADLTIYSANPIQTYAAKLELTLSHGKVIYKEGDAMKCFI